MLKEYYSEIQKFRQKWILLITIVPSVIMIFVFAFGIYNQIFNGKSFGTNAMPDLSLIITGIFATIIAILVPVLLLTSNLQIKVLNDGIYFKYFPFILKFRKISFLNIEKFEAREYSPMKEFGGWGIRYSFKNKSMAYNVSGNQGVEFHLNDGRVILFGTQKPAEFYNAVKEATGKLSNN